MWRYWVLAISVGWLAVPLTAAAQDQSRRPEVGGSRAFEQFPPQGAAHLPDAMVENGAPHALDAVFSDPRSETADDTLDELFGPDSLP